MPITKIQSFEVFRWSILDENGIVDEKMMPALSDKQLVFMYEQMVRSRLMDDKCLKLQRQGRMGTFAPILGQEAQVGAALAMEHDDWLVPSFRENGCMIVRGVPMVDIFLLFGGDERGNQMPPGVNVLPISIPVGSQALHGAGLGMAFKLRNEKKAAVAFFGDGATSEGDFHEALNFGGVFGANTVFVCQNNQWAISLSRKHQTAAESLAQKAIAYGIEGIQVDGNDGLATYAATKYALDKAKSGKGSTFLEFVTYRMGDHTTADDATKYRDTKEVELWKKRDPLLRMQKFLEKKKLWSADIEFEIVKKYSLEVEEAVKQYEGMPKADAREIFQYVFEKPTVELMRQRDVLLEYLKKAGEENAH